jgi:hypothetical protein
MSIVLLPPRRSLSHPTPAEAKLRRPHRFVNNNRKQERNEAKEVKSIFVPFEWAEEKQKHFDWLVVLS